MMIQLAMMLTSSLTSICMNSVVIIVVFFFLMVNKNRLMVNKKPLNGE